MNQTAAQTPSRARNLLAQVLPDRTVHRVGEIFYNTKLRWDILRRKRSPFVTGYLKRLKRSGDWGGES